MKQITIYELLPLLRPGFVAMDEDGEWWWYGAKPVLDTEPLANWSSWGCEVAPISDLFNIAPYDGDWKDSLMECGQ